MNAPSGALSEAVKARARELAFDACAIAEAGSADPEDHLGAWLGQGYHADMKWMADTAAIRRDSMRKLPEARSVVVVAKNYYQPLPPPLPTLGRIARYALGKDYHKAVKKPLVELARFIDTHHDGDRSYVSVDSGPVMERSWAERSGLGWIGKNSLVLRRDIGSWFFLGVILTPLELAPDAPVADQCGTCTACLDACPTGAIVSPKVVDSNQCISYQTIENRGEIPEALHKDMGSWVFGCDICQEVCPWNRFARPTTEAAFAPRATQDDLELERLASLEEDAFDALFHGTPVRRTKLRGMRRNAQIALGNG
ncbi:MAG: tRNA epoxyqueuosine(34) reductase QueG [Candidatus Hydrogenedentes bacterium]|nr:tRNA epoxyqueuosine(34) reductase QueG [Candidatus Hydrogenedentota bacterium]